MAVVSGCALDVGCHAPAQPLRADSHAECDRLGPEFVQFEEESFTFCCAYPGSDLARKLPDDLYLVRNGTTWVTLRQTEDDRRTLYEVTIADAQGRPWITANLQDGSFYYNWYRDAAARDPELSISDDDGDGIPDKMVNWCEQRGYSRTGGVQWTLLQKQERAGQVTDEP